MNKLEVKIDLALRTKEAMAGGTDEMKKLLPYFKQSVGTVEPQFLWSLYKKVLLSLARVSFEHFIEYMELNDTHAFYQTRRKYLRKVVKKLDELMDDKLDCLCIMLPQRVGKSTLASYALLYFSGRFQDASSVGLSAGKPTAMDFVKKARSLLTSYGDKYEDIFGIPVEQILKNSGAESNREMILDPNSNYPSITFQFLRRGASTTGYTEASGLLYIDDPTTEDEALNPERMDAVFDKIRFNLTRTQITPKVLSIGTPFGEPDTAIGNRVHQAMLDLGLKSEILRIPMLDENDESNFECDIFIKGKVTKQFTTESMLRMRSLQMQTEIGRMQWASLYQMENVKLGNLIFKNIQWVPHEMKSIIDDVPGETLAVLDPSGRTGGDSTSCIIAKVTKFGVFVLDVYHNNTDEIGDTIEAIATKLEICGATKLIIESNTGGGDTWRKLFKQRIFIEIRLITQNKNKMERILAASPIIISKFYFLSERMTDVHYQKFTKELKTFNRDGKNLHDDAPDVCAYVAESTIKVKQSTVATVYSMKEVYGR